MGEYTAVFEQHGDWWVGYVEELPGAHTQGHTLDEAGTASRRPRASSSR